MTEHTRTDGLSDTLIVPSPADASPSPGGTPSSASAATTAVQAASDAAAHAPRFLERSRPRNERMASNKIECNACPVLCQITEGSAGACDRYANEGGALVRLDPVLILRRQAGRIVEAVPLATASESMI